MRLVLLALFLGVTLDTTLTDGNLSFVVQTDAPRSFYVQIDTIGGASTQAPTIYQFELAAGEQFGRTIPVFGPGSIAVRVWASDGGEPPTVEALIPLPAHHIYMPLINRT